MKKLASVLFFLFISNAFAHVTIPLNPKDFSHHQLDDIYTGHKKIILTFDDGPNPVTSKFLDLLAEYEIKASFFVIGANVQKRPDLVSRAVAEGHVIGNHSMTHFALKNLDPLAWKDKVKSEVLDAHEVIVPYMTNDSHFYYRAPEAAWAQKYADFLNEDPIGRDYIGPVLWDIGGEMQYINGKLVQAADWDCWAKKVSVDDCLKGYLYEINQKRGGVVLMHDLTSKSFQLLSKLIPELEDRGYSFGTLNDIEWKSNLHGPPL
jgi:peptidoglycan/xylan/chitin deacetylase (PgdA/CDA1 family)